MTLIWMKWSWIFMAARKKFYFRFILLTFWYINCTVFNAYKQYWNSWYIHSYKIRIIYIPPWSKSSRNLFRKLNIQVYSSKSILSPSKLSPSTATHLCQCLIQSSKHFLYSVFGMSILRFFHYFLSAAEMRLF